MPNFSATESALHPPPAPEAGLHARNLACRRGGRPVFAGLDFALPPGEALMIVGPNGAGKSSLLRLAAGLLRPAAGEIRRDGRPLGRAGRGGESDILHLGHADGLKPELTPREQLRLEAALRPAPPRAAPTAALAAMGGAPLADLPLRFLSAGQRRRVACARLAASRAGLWLLDEPASALDREGRARLAALMGDHLAAGGLILVASHDPLDVPARRLDLAALPAEPAAAPMEMGLEMGAEMRAEMRAEARA